MQQPIWVVIGHITAVAWFFGIVGMEKGKTHGLNLSSHLYQETIAP